LKAGESEFFELEANTHGPRQEHCKKQPEPELQSHPVPEGRPNARYFAGFD
jgi:hypothetical protein